MKALIGVTSIPRQARTGFDAPIAHETVPEMYLDLIRRADGIPVILPVHGDFEADLAARLDGVLLTGGGDIDPAEYRQQQTAATHWIDRQRDRFELDLVRFAVDSDMPVLAICRGVQVLNVALGGTLLQDIATEAPGAAAHWHPERWAQDVHPVRLDPGSFLARVLGEEITVNSMHHQALGQLGDGLAVTARAPDGVAEAVEAPQRHFLVGVQWHPECLGHGHPSFRLFQSFVAAAREVKT